MDYKVSSEGAAKMRSACENTERHNTSDARDQYKNARNAAQKILRQEHGAYVNNIIGEGKSNPKSFYRYIKSKRVEQTDIPQLVTQNGTVDDDAGKAKVLNTQFSSVFTKENLELIPRRMSTGIPKMPNITVTLGVTKLLLGLNEHKAKGPESVSSRLLK